VILNPTKILIVDDDDDVLLAAKLLLKQHASVVQTEKNPEKIPALLKQQNYDVILLDMNFTRDVSSGMEGFHWLKKILELDPQAVVILITAYGDVNMAVRAIKEGAMDFVLKPWQNEKLLATLSAAMNLRQSRLDAHQSRSRERTLSSDLDQPYHDFIGTSSAMQKVFSTIEKVAKTDANVLILGQNGTGKELVARAIHRQSVRADQVFINVDLGALTETLFESELFGHLKGAFTDAKEDRAGRFEIASGGTLFLDEIGNLSLTLQAKLLTVLQNREVTRIGSHKAMSIDIRLICATNMPIYDMVGEKQFRQDLLYRINTVEVNLPLLRERLDDIPQLAKHFLQTYSRKYQKNIKEIHASAMKKLLQSPWHGNVRELQHTIERAVIMSESNILRSEDFLLSSAPAKNGGLVIEDYNLEEIEKVLIRKALGKHGGNVSHAAKELGLTRTSLYRRIEKYGL